MKHTDAMRTSAANDSAAANDSVRQHDVLDSGGGMCPDGGNAVSADDTSCRTVFSNDDATAIVMWGRVINGFQTTNRLLHSKCKAKFDLSEAEVETLLSLHLHPDHRAPLNALSRATAFSTGGFTKIADKLTARELTVRAGCTADRRVTYLQLTELGAKLAAELAAFVAGTNREHVIDVLGADRAQALADAMTELHRANRQPAP